MGVNLGLRSPDQRSVERWAWTAVAANTLIILTGGLVRLTGSGLGCPTWPRCTDSSFTPHSSLGVHGAIEFSNRMLTYVLTAVVVATLVAVWRWSGRTTTMRRLAWALVLGIPLQAVVGGISVLTDLNPWVVSLHLVISLFLVAAAVRLLTLVRGDSVDDVPAGSVALGWTVFVLAWFVVYLGTVVTGSGPHAGDADAPRNGLDPRLWSHLHGYAVAVLIVVTIVTWWTLQRSGAPTAGLAGAVVLVELAQGAIGVVQYLTDLPVALVAAHLVGAAVLVGGVTRLVISLRPAPSRPSPETVAASPQVRPTRSR